MSSVSTIRELTLELRTNNDLRREAYSMSLYVSIVLLSALSVLDDHPPDRGEVFLLELGHHGRSRARPRLRVVGVDPYQR